MAMSVLLFSILTLAGLGIATVQEQGFISKAFRYGRKFWSQWLPVVAIGVFSGILMVNLVSLAPGRPLTLHGFMSSREILVLLMSVPMFFFSSGNFVGLATVAYFGFRAYTADPSTDLLGSGPILLPGAAAVLAVLSDRMPFHSRRRNNSRPLRLVRESLLDLISLVALVAAFYTLANIREFRAWNEALFFLKMPKLPLFLSLCVICFGWISVIAGFGPPALLITLSVFTSVVIGFALELPPTFMVSTFAAIIALATSDVDRVQIAYRWDRSTRVRR